MTVDSLPTTTPLPTIASAALCETTLSVGGVLSFGPGIPLTTLTHAAVLETPCAPGQTPTASPMPIRIAQHDSHIGASASSGPQYSDFRDPFYASTFPVCYALAATTVTAYMLVIMLFITPRSFLDGGIVYLGRRGFTGHSSGGITIGGRPWLQKVAAMTVAISLTIATADTFRVAEEQYSWGVQNADKLQVEVMDSTNLKAIRLVSDTFLWLAQAQTLIRLFPRQRAKVIIKWTAFALITLQVIFSALNSFYYTASGSQGNARPQSFVHAVPTLSYLFHLSLGLLYAAWVIYYALMKKRYAFYHPLMKNMVLVSVLSFISILVPVVFFVLDISRPEFIGWGDYVRWVGAAAASVVVWEWVERIEALEREEKKDGILGREIFDGDEMMEPPSSESSWLRRRINRKRASGGGPGVHGGGGVDDNGDDGASQRSATAMRRLVWPGLTSIPPRYQGNYQHEQQQQQQQHHQQHSTDASRGEVFRPPLWPSRPAAVVTPASRTDTASAASTVYAVRYQAGSETTGRTPEGFTRQRNTALPSQADDNSVHSDSDSDPSQDGPREVVVAAPIPRQRADAAALDPDPSADSESQRPTARSTSASRSMVHVDNTNSSRNARTTPSSVMTTHAAATTSSRGRTWARDRYGGTSGRWDFRARLEEFAATQAEKIREKLQPTPETDSLPVTVVPAPPRQGAALAQLLEEERARASGAQAQQPPVRSAGEALAFPTFHELGTGTTATTPGLGWTASSTQSAMSPGPSQSAEVDNANQHRPPLWPGIRVPHDFDYAGEAESPTLHPRRGPDQDGRASPTP